MERYYFIPEAIAKNFKNAGKMIVDVWKENKDEGTTCTEDVQSETVDPESKEAESSQQ